MSQLKSLEIHFKRGGLDCSAVFNFFASVFATGLYMYFLYAHPTQVITWPGWQYFLLAALAFTIMYLGLFIYKKDRVEGGADSWAILLGFVLYVLVFATLTTGFGLLKLFEPYVIITGEVVNEDGRGMASVIIELDDQQDYSRSTISDERGRFVILVEKENLSSVSRAILTSRDGEQERHITLGSGFSAPSWLHRVVLPKGRGTP